MITDKYHHVKSHQTISNEQILPQNDSRNKLRLLFALFLLGFLVVLGRLFYIQVIKSREYREQARKQYESTVTLAAHRGDIFDRNGNLIANTSQKLSVAVDPNMVEQPELICSLISLLTGKPAEEYLLKIQTAHSSFVWLERAIDNATLSPLDTLHDAGLIRVNEPRRKYLNGSLAAQLLGFTDVDNKGVSGIELQLDTLLRGANGFMTIQRDGRGKKRPAPDLPYIAPRHGKSLELTLDMQIQGIVESELKRGVLDADAESGTVIAMCPATGEILAMASYPTFDPNNLATSSAEIIRNRAITDMYEPGSTFKLITAAALLEDQKISQNDTVDAHGGTFTMKDYTITDAHPMGKITFAKAIEQSSNIAFATLSPRLPNDKFYKYSRDFGFGIFLGIDMPGEVRGILKKPREFDATTKMFMAYGYQLAATSLQIVNAYATVANGGVMMKPYIVKKLLEENHDEIQKFEPQRIRRVISEATAHTLTELFCGVVERGTGYSARVNGLRIAGKTGTAQQLVGGKYSKQNYTASFVGYFPADKPEIAMVVMLDKPRKGYYGSQVSAPIFQAIAQRIVSASLISVPDNQAPAQIASEKQDRQTSEVPDVRGLNSDEAREILHRAGLRLQTTGNTGIVIEQTPPPGAWIEKGNEVSVKTKERKQEDEATTNNPRPDVRGMTLRRALNILHSAHVEVRILGSGVVVNQHWEQEKELVCILECKQ